MHHLFLFRDSSAVEQSAVNRSVVGSNPTRGAIFYGVSGEPEALNVLHGSILQRQ